MGIGVGSACFVGQRNANVGNDFLAKKYAPRDRTIAINTIQTIPLVESMVSRNVRCGRVGTGSGVLVTGLISDSGVDTTYNSGHKEIMLSRVMIEENDTEVFLLVLISVLKTHHQYMVVIDTRNKT